MKPETKKKITKWFWILLTVPVLAVALLILAVALFAKIPSFEELENPDSKLATLVIAQDGEVLTTFHIENRTFVSYNELSPHIIHAAVATEDARFYRHSGIDLRGLARVFVKTILMRDSSQGGGSTITQQLAKTLYPRTEVKSKFPLAKPAHMVWTKLKEWITAVKLERDYTKDEIMDMYLNSIFFGSNAFGIRAASETFFGKLPSELTVEESAMLIGMINKPTRYNPAINPELALERRNFVISRMAKTDLPAETGFPEEYRVLTKAAADSIQQVPVVLSYEIQDHNAGIAPYFRDMLRRIMNAQKPKRSNYTFPEDFAADSLFWETDDFYGWLNKNKKPNGESYNLDKDGLRIYTTINYKMQKYAEEAVAEQLGGYLQAEFQREARSKRRYPFSNDVEQEVVDRIMRQARRNSDRFRQLREEGMSENEALATFSEPTKMRVFSWSEPGYIDTTMTPDDSIRYCKGFLRAAFMAVEPTTGHVKAYVGGPNYRYFKYDNLRQGKRQVGSTVKPFLYTLAMQEGMTPCDQVVNVPQSFIVGEDTWTPRSTDRDEWIGRTVTLKWGLTNSSNNISAYLMKQYGPQAMAQQMHKMGVYSHVDEVYALCVGSCDLPPYEMIAAFNTFPSKGVYVTPMFVTRIEDSQGNVLGEFTNRKTEAISEQTAFLMVNLMQGVVNSGTGTRLRSRYGLKGEIGGKTGTTNDNSDGWFIGYTPSITAGVWVGGEDPQVHFESMALGQGANAALPIWGLFMQKVIADGTLGISERDRFISPPGMQLDLSCSGADSDAVTQQKKEDEDYYFE